MVDCPWPLDLSACCDQTGIDAADERIPQVIAQVSAMMTLWSGGAIGGCRTVRPLEPCGICRSSGCCGAGDCIVLHNAARVTEVRLYGEVVPPSEYHFDAARGILCAVPPFQWPTNDPRWEDIGSLEVDVATGEEPDAWALTVANELACEVLRSCANDKKCRIPKNAVAIDAQGVSIQLTPEEIKYSIPAVTAWVETINPRKAFAPARVFSREADRVRTQGAQKRIGIMSMPWQAGSRGCGCGGSGCSKCGPITTDQVYTKNEDGTLVPLSNTLNALETCCEGVTSALEQITELQVEISDLATQIAQLNSQHYVLSPLGVEHTSITGTSVSGWGMRVKRLDGSNVVGATVRMVLAGVGRFAGSQTNMATITTNAGGLAIAPRITSDETGVTTTIFTVDATEQALINPTTITWVTAEEENVQVVEVEENSVSQVEETAALKKQRKA